MLNRFLALMVLLCLPAAGVLAQEPECNPPYEMVTKLHKAEPGAYTVWNTLYGVPEYDEGFDTILPHEGGGVVAAGKRRKVGSEINELVFVTFDRLGRKTRERAQVVSDLQDVIKMLPTPEGYVVLAQIKKARAEIWLGFFDKDFMLRSQKIHADERDDLFVSDIIPSIDGSGWVISVSYVRKLGPEADAPVLKNGAVVTLNKAGEMVKKRAYSVGNKSEILSLAVLKKKGLGSGYIATGYFENGAGKNLAFAMALSTDLSLVWQNEYSRGLSAKFNTAESYRDDYILAFGDVVPGNGGALGTWLALLDAGDGAVLWQRYYYGGGGTHDHSAKSLYVSQQGLIILMMDALANSGRGAVADEAALISDDMDYAQVLTLSPRGITLDGNTYFYGHGVVIGQMVEGPDGQRLMAGKARVPVEQESKKGKSAALLENPPLTEGDIINLPDVELSDKARKGLELLQKNVQAQNKNPAAVVIEESAKRDSDLMEKGWVVVGDKFDTYNDPCAR